MMLIAVIEERRKGSDARPRGLGRAEIPVVSRCRDAAVPGGARKIGGRRVDNAMPPMNAQHALAPEILGALHVHLETARSKLRKPHRRIVLKPGNRPTLPAAQLAESFICRIPTQRVVEGRKDDVFGNPLMKGLEMLGHSTPAGEY